MSCPDCTSGNLLPGSPKGIGKNGAYFAKGSGQGKTNDKAVVVLADIFGLAISNPKIIADTISERTGFDVWFPDLFNGCPPVRPEVLDSFTPRLPGEKMGFWKKVMFCLAALVHLPRLIASRPVVVDARAENFLTGIKAERGYENIGTASVALFPSLDAITSLVIAHPGLSASKAIKAINKPVSWVLAEDDFRFSNAFRLQLGAHFKSCAPAVQCEFADYPGTVHGFAIRPAREQSLSVEGQEKALEQTLKWFLGTL